MMNGERTYECARGRNDCIAPNICDTVECGRCCDVLITGYGKPAISERSVMHAEYVGRVRTTWGVLRCVPEFNGGRYWAVLSANGRDLSWVRKIIGFREIGGQND
jgi:hypothetical protein